MEESFEQVPAVHRLALQLQHQERPGRRHHRRNHHRHHEHPSRFVHFATVVHFEIMFIKVILEPKLIE